MEVDPTVAEGDTIKIQISSDSERKLKELLTSVYNALKESEKGYDPISQIVGYILSEDPGYITNHKNARSLIRHIDRDELLRALVKHYLDD
ncbi:MAG: IreB family regulatory phosphoprotein [Clostridia bacterium]|nr:IreB family regulatory phosphoprotein [Clostridia bacterium]